MSNQEALLASLRLQITALQAGMVANTAAITEQVKLLQERVTVLEQQAAVPQPITPS